jgi:hypothetical protein
MRRLLRVASVVAVVLAVAWGLILIAVAATLGHCSAFGGRCPADPPPLWDDDTFGMSALGGALIAGPLLALRHDRRRWWLAVAGAVVAALLIGLVVRSAAHG